MTTALPRPTGENHRRSRRLRIISVIAAALAALGYGQALASGAADMPSPGGQCRAAIASAERAYGIPHRLLAAVGLIESGRRDPAAGQWTPWPWAIDVGGQGIFFPTKQAAITAVRLLQARGISSIDIGCLQINLSYHSDAFANLQQAFDPELNVAYGARFLKALFGQTGNWITAVGQYHSMTTALAKDYRQRVLAAWSGNETEQARPSPLQALARAWAATLDTSPQPSEASWSAPVATVSFASSAPHHRKTGLCVSHRLRACRSGASPLWQASLEYR